jgi:DNA-directed RNA polymerase
MGRADMANMCKVLDTLGEVKWQVNHKVLSTMEYMWSAGGGVGKIPKKFNERKITPEMIKEAPFREKLKLLKEH